MNKKNIILVSKACLLLSMLGFCIPVFDEANGFAALIYFLGAGEGALYVSIGIALILCFLAMAASILFSSLYFIRGKKENHTPVTAALDWALMALVLVTMLFSFIAVKKFTEEDVEFASGFYFMVYGMAAHIIVYLYSTLLGENLSTKSEEKRAYWMLSLPAIIFYFGVMTFPSIFSVVLSLTNYSGGSLFEAGALKFVGLKNYMKVFADQYFYISLKNNFWIVLVSVFGQLPLGFFLAYVLTRGLVKGRDFFQTMIYLPCVISTVVIGILFQTFFSSHGAWTEIMKWINPSYEWTMNSQPMIPVLFVILWMYTGTYLIIFMANLQKIDPQIMEAATIDGASEWQVLWHIIFPELSGVFVISAILAISGSLKSFDLIYVMTGGGPAKQTYVLSLYMFDKAFRGASDYPMANTISTIMVVISLVLIGIVKTLEKKFGAKEE